MGHFIKHKADSEPRTHRGGGKVAIHALLKGLGGGSAGMEEEGHGRRCGRGTRAQMARCSGLGRWTTWGGAPARGGAPTALGEGLARG